MPDDTTYTHTHTHTQTRALTDLTEITSQTRHTTQHTHTHTHTRALSHVQEITSKTRHTTTHTHTHTHTHTLAQAPGQGEKKLHLVLSNYPGDWQPTDRWAESTDLAYFSPEVIFYLYDKMLEK